MRRVAGVLVGLAGVGGAVYLGIVVFLVGGIERIVDGVNADPADSSDIAWGVVQVLFYGSVAGIVAFLAILLALFIGTGESRRQRRKHSGITRGPLYRG